ncbi:MAG: triose-phosphate isomerase [Candidatus Curtissbacteria bacterium]|nr:triose-phosphate isomerase [Candidatus Curtissbacteria bacterium]
MSDFPLLVANLKANKSWDEMSAWIEEVGKNAQGYPGTIVVCPTLPFLSAAKQKIDQEGLKITLGSQDVSAFEAGPYTGEVAASQIVGLCEYAIVGHSERRGNFKEDEDTLEKKVKNTLAAGLKPIYCVPDENSPIPEGTGIVAFEPIAAIGTGEPDSPQNAQRVASVIKSNGQHTVIYGGSVNAQNARAFLKEDIIDGLLVGTDSLESAKFIAIIEAISL